jgi:hypothetical protein
MAIELRQYIRSKKWLPIIDTMEKWVEHKTSGGKIKRKKETWVRLGLAPKIGLVISNGYKSVGWSLRNPCDAFNSEEALRVAREHMKIRANADDLDDVPPSLRDAVKTMLQRSRRFYKKTA